MGSIGKTSHIRLCSGISGSGSSVTHDPAGTWVYIKAKEPRRRTNYKSRITKSGYHKSHKAPTSEYEQMYQVNNATAEAKDIDDITDWLTDTIGNDNDPIYLLVEKPDGAGGFELRSWYDGSRSKVYYLRGCLEFFEDQGKAGKLCKVSFKFVEYWGT